MVGGSDLPARAQVLLQMCWFWAAKGALLQHFWGQDGSRIYRFGAIRDTRAWKREATRM